jgi:hypothetical protein
LPHGVVGILLIAQEQVLRASEALDS